MNKPYFQDEWAKIYLGDCREILPQLEPCDVIYVDPVWPNSTPILAGAERPYELFAEAAAYFPKLAKRVIVHLGCNSDPRFLSGIPSPLPFFRACWLEYARPHYLGRVLYGNDVAYLFGEPPPSRDGNRVIPGRMIDHSSDGKQADHPCPRKVAHVQWLLARFCDGDVIDPMCGSGTALVAAKDLCRHSIGIEIEERYAEIAAKRLSQSVMPL